MRRLCEVELARQERRAYSGRARHGTSPRQPPALPRPGGLRCPVTRAQAPPASRKPLTEPGAARRTVALTRTGTAHQPGRSPSGKPFAPGISAKTTSTMRHFLIAFAARLTPESFETRIINVPISDVSKQLWPPPKDCVLFVTYWPRRSFAGCLGRVAGRACLERACVVVVSVRLAGPLVHGPVSRLSPGTGNTWP
jgi:hypothetical protein